MSNRTTVSIRFDEDLLYHVEDFIDENDMQKAEFFEKAASEFMDNDRYARIESKLDDVLSEVSGNTRRDSGGEPSTPRSDGGDKKNIADSTPTENIHEYNPGTWTEQLSKEQLQELLKTGDGPALNPEHLPDTLPGTTSERADTIAAVARYQHSTSGQSENPPWVHRHHAKELVKEHLGDSRHYLDESKADYPGKVLDRLPHPTIIDSDTLRETEHTGAKATQADLTTHYEKQYEGLRDWAEAEFLEPVGDLEDVYPYKGYGYLLAELDALESEWVDRGIASESEIAETRKDLQEHRDTVDEFVSTVSEHTNQNRVYRMPKSEIVAGSSLSESIVDALIGIGQSNIGYDVSTRTKDGEPCVKIEETPLRREDN